MMQEASWVVILKRLYNISLHSMDQLKVISNFRESLYIQKISYLIDIAYFAS